MNFAFILSFPLNFFSQGVSFLFGHLHFNSLWAKLEVDLSAASGVEFQL